MEANSTQENHAIFLSLPLQGHINPFVQLSLKLASKGFTITFLVFESIHQEITRARNATRLGPNNGPGDIFEVARVGPDPFDIRYRVISDGLPVDFDRTARLDEYLEWYLYGGMYAKLEEAIGEIMLESKKRPDVLVADTFYPWASKIAKKFGLFHASFWTEPALVFSLYYHVHLLREHRHFDSPDARKDPIDYIPGVKSIDPKDMMSYLQDKDTSTNMHKIIFTAFQDVRFADFVLCNTVQDIELDTISALQALVPFYAIGPIMQLGPAQSVRPPSLWAESSCSEWLDTKSDGSVLYVSFGSLANFTKNDVMEIAYGLMLSNVGFIWVLRPRTVVHECEDLLPQGFEEAIHGRGIVVPWTNQTAILSHHAIGGFLTHCGWNSVLESIWSKVPMLCFPVFTDQITNRKLVVDDWKVGINLCDEKAIRREDVSAKITNFMSTKVRDELCKRVKEVRKILENALNINGSSEKNLDLFIDKLKK